MKKIIMFVMVLAISAPALADDLNPPDWSCGPGTVYGIWNFDEESPSGDTADPAFREDYPEEGWMEPHDTYPNPEEHTETSDTGAHQYMMQNYTDGETQDWWWLANYEGRKGVICASMGLGFELNNFPGDSTKLIRVQITWWPFLQNEGPEGPGAEEVWIERPFGDELSYVEDDFLDHLVAEIEDVGDGWKHSTYEFEISSQDWDIVWIGFQNDEIPVDQVVIDTICYSGDEPEDGPGYRPGAPQPPVTVDFNDVPVYEPADPCGPPLLGPTEGQLLVSLGWRPGESLDYPAFTAKVTVDPNEGNVPNEDFEFIKPPTDPNGNVYLTFTEANWNVPQQVQVKAIQDLDREGYMKYPIELTVTIDIADPNFNNKLVGANVSVVDNDVPFISLSTHEIELSENDPGVCVDLKVRLSHRPDYDVYVRVYSDTGPVFGEGGEEEMAYLDPPLGVADDPNVLTFTTADGAPWVPGTMTSGWNVEQTVTVCPIDNDELAEAWLEFVPGDIWIPGFSEDVRYLAPWLNSDGTDADDPCTPDDEEESGGELEQGHVSILVQDNECGAWGFDAADYNEDCRVGLADFAHYLAQWLICTDPYDDGGFNQWGDCDAIWNIVVE